VKIQTDHKMFLHIQSLLLVTSDAT
jgi:hypothetical protein